MKIRGSSIMHIDMILPDHDEFAFPLGPADMRRDEGQQHSGIVINCKKRFLLAEQGSIS